MSKKTWLLGISIWLIVTIALVGWIKYTAPFVADSHEDWRDNNITKKEREVLNLYPKGSYEWKILTARLSGCGCEHLTPVEEIAEKSNDSDFDKVLEYWCAHHGWVMSQDVYQEAKDVVDTKLEEKVI